MNIDILVPLITGVFLGGIVTEIRWIRRFREFQRQIGSAQAEASVEGAHPEAQSSLSLRSLYDHLAAEAEVAPVKEPATLVKRDR
jgi:hypothetical protein